MKKTSVKKHINSTQIMVLGFLFLISIGTILLCLPISSADNTFTSPIDAAFTAVSASCVTGLITLDTASHWNMFGHTVILLLIQIGGLGFMSFTVLFLMLVKRKISPRDSILVAMSYNINTFDSILSIVKRIFLGTILIEGAGAILLSIRFIPDYGLSDGIYKSIFHAVSAFCNAGFDIVGTGNHNILSMSHYVTDPLINFTLAFLIILGGIGFLVWNDFVNSIKTKRVLSTYSKFVIIITAILIFTGTTFFAIFEWTNPETIGKLSIFDKLMASFFQSVTWRTAGFATIANNLFTDNSQLLGILLMFIGGASGSTAGGVKVATFGILVYTIWCVAIGKKRTILYGRKISDNSFVRATAVICVQLTVSFIAVLLISSSCDFTITEILYEVISAISTVGVTAGITPYLNIFSKIIVMLLMFFGRVGVLTVTYAVLKTQSAKNSTLDYPEINMPIG